MNRSLCVFAITATCLMAAPMLMAQNQGVAINTTGAAPNAAAMLDITSTTAGLLIPRMTLAQRPAAGPAGLWIYQTDNNPGFYYYDLLCACPGAAWVRMATGVGWEILGNNNLVAGNYLGTSDATDFVWRTNNVERMRVTAAGRLGIGVTTPTEAVSVNGGIRIFNSATNNLTNGAGGIRFNTAPPANYPTVHEGNNTGAVAGWQRLENSFRTFLNQDYEGFIESCGNGQAVCATANSLSTGPADTPFPTAVGRGSRVQYLIPETELLANKVCHGNITEIAFRVIDDDPQGTAPAGCQVTIQLRMSNAGALATMVAYDAATMASPNLAVVVATTNVTVASGWFTIPLVGAGFNWLAGNNMIIDIAISRSITAGISPRVELTAGLAYSATHFGYDGGPTQGWNFNDSPNPASGTFGNQNSRPIIRFTGQAQVPTPMVQQDDFLLYTGGLLVGTPAWAAGAGVYQGPGVIRAQNAVYDGVVQLSDHVFDRYYDGRTKLDDEVASLGYIWTELDDLKEKLKTDRHLPHMPSREEWEKQGGASLGELQTGLWRTVEDQALYITELEKDLSMLEDLAFSKGISDAQLNELTKSVMANPRLNQEQKDHILESFRSRNSDHANSTAK